MLSLQRLRGCSDSTHYHAFHALRPNKGLHIPREAEGHRFMAPLELEARVVGGNEISMGDGAHAAGNQQLARRAPGEQQHVAGNSCRADGHDNGGHFVNEGAPFGATDGKLCWITAT